MAQSVRDPRLELYERYQQVSSHEHAEIVRGTLYVMPRPGPPHAAATSVLGGELSGPFQRGRGGPGGWWILFEPELQLVAFEPVVPDLAGWRVERMPALPDTSFFTVPPDWVCEVLSKSTEKLDRTDKLALYAEHGVRFVWLLDPISRTLEVHVLGEPGHWREVRTYQGNVCVRAVPFDAIEIELAASWSPPKVG